jgi:glucose-1-phosphate thymidylyltransferase
MAAARASFTDRAVVLARGAGRRMQAEDPAAVLTDEQRRAADAGLKALMPIGGRPFLDYVLSSLADAGVRDVALIVAPEHGAVRARYERDAPPRRVRLAFVVQAEARGTADAILAAEVWTGHEPFLSVNSDNLYPVDVLRSLVESGEPALPVFRRADLVRDGNVRDDQVHTFALVEVTRDGYLARIVEKPDPHLMSAAGGDALLSMNCWAFDARIFDACRAVPRSPRGEFELPQAVMLAVERGVRFRAIPAAGAVLDLSRRGDTAEVARRLQNVVPTP